MTSKKDIDALRVGYYRLSGENRAIVIARAGELVAEQEERAADPEREARKKSGSMRGIATGDKPDEAR